MKTYHYEHIVFKAGFVSYTPDRDIRDLISDYAVRGYRYAGYVPSKMGSYGVMKEIDLIFEKDSEF